MASRLDRIWADYEGHHHSSGNKYCHRVGIPLIILGTLGLLAVPTIQLGRLTVDLALLLVVVVGLTYVVLDVKLGAAMVVAMLVLYLLGRKIHWPVALGLFLSGWFLQAIGHGIYEKRAPAFLGNLAHLVVGPLWVLNHFLHIRKERTPLAIENHV